MIFHRIACFPARKSYFSATELDLKARQKNTKEYWIMHFEAKNILDSSISSFLLFIDPGTARLFDEIREKFTLRNNFSAILAYLA